MKIKFSMEIQNEHCFRLLLSKDFESAVKIDSRRYLYKIES